MATLCVDMFVSFQCNGFHIQLCVIGHFSLGTVCMIMPQVVRALGKPSFKVFMNNVRKSGRAISRFEAENGLNIIHT